MNDQHNPYDPYHQPQIVGYDEYGQPVYRQPQQYDPYAQQQDGHSGQRDARGRQGDGSQDSQQGHAHEDGYESGRGYSQDGYGSGQNDSWQGFASAQGYDSGQGYDTRQGYDSGQGYDSRQGYDSGQDYDSRQSYDSGQGYGAGQRYGSTHDHDSGQDPTRAPGYGYDPYSPQAQTGRQFDTYAGGQSGYAYDTGPQPAVDTTAQWSIPHQQDLQQHQHQHQQQEQQHQREQQNEQGRRRPSRPDAEVEEPAAVPAQRRPETGADRDYRTEQFSFIEEPDEDSEDVIDWLKFTESRSERREEAKRRGRNRVVAFMVVMALALVGGVGYLWYADKLPGVSGSESKSEAAAGPQKRDVIVVHLHNTKKEGTSTALLVDNATTGQGTTVLLPNTLSVANDDGTATTLGKSVEDDGSTGTREAIGTLLGAEISGTWRLDTPYLENLVELVGTIDLSTDTEVPGAKKGDAPLVKKGENQTLNGRAAVAYATHLAPGEAEQKQLLRFGQVMQAVLKKLPDDPKSATVVVETLAQILDPSLNERDLGTSLAQLAEHAKGGDYQTAVLPVQQDGTLSDRAATSVVKDVLGGSVSAPEPGDTVRVGIRNGSGDAGATEKARVTLINGGYNVIDGGKADTVTASQVTYGDDKQKAKAVEVAQTLGLPADAVKKGKAATNADVSVVLGPDFETQAPE